ncbi:hypothetical protein LTR08_001631 [Meristemomyces frigidus]|nr:hypothetical protein LTR08_001631 [Meristemomyces frigidus]
MGAMGLLRRPLRAVRAQLPPLNFITIHYLYFIGTALLFAVVFWGSSTPARSVTFTDSLFVCVSAMTEAGLNTVNLSALNTFQQVLLFVLIVLGSAIWVSAWVVQVRKSAFEREFRVFVGNARERRGRSGSRSRMRSWSMGRRSAEAAREGAVGQLDEKLDEAGQQGFDTLDALDALQPGEEVAKAYSTLDGQERAQHLHSPPTSPSRSTHTNVTFRPDTRFGRSPASPGLQRPRRSSSIFTMQGVGARPTPTLRLGSPVHLTSSTPPGEDRDSLDAPKPPSPHITRNSQFRNLTPHQRQTLGGREYRAVSLLAWLVPLYFTLWQLLGCLGCAAWVAYNAPDTARQNGLNPWWVGAFNAVSAFNNSGMSLLDANMTAFQKSYYLLTTMSLLILAGNTCYPIFLRLIVWCMWKSLTATSPSIAKHFSAPQWQERALTLRFLLDHPRRCYTNLFPAQHTWWLLFAVITLNGVDWAAFEILNLNNRALYDALPERYRVIDGLFQAFAVRSGGFYVVSIPTLRIALQVLYVVMMYVSVYPVVITMRNSNVYEERSLGIYAADREEQEAALSAAEASPHSAGACKAASKSSTGPPSSGGGGSNFWRSAQTLRRRFTPRTPHPPPHPESNTHFIHHQLRAQLAHDAWLIALALFLILIIESAHFAANPAVFSVFNFLFEIVSGYGCVGISVGLPGADYSFCGAWHGGSKLVLAAVMLRGRHRGLPVAIDKAVLLPGGEGWREEGGEDDRGVGVGVVRTVSRGREG